MLDESTSISWESKFQSDGWDDFYVLLFRVVYLAWSDFVMDPTKEQHQILGKILNQCNRDPDID
jgi:hypothetical protein